MKKYTYRILGLYFAVILIWGIGWPVTKLGLDYMPPLWYSGLRLVIATISMTLLALCFKKFSLPRREDFPLIITIALFQITLYVILVNFGLTYMPAGRAALLAYTTPLWIMPAATWLFHEESTARHWIGFVLAIIGLFLLVSPWEMNWSNSSSIIGVCLLLAASLSWSIAMLCVRYMHWKKPPLELMPWQLLISTIPVLLLAEKHEAWSLINWNATLIFSLVYAGILVSAISYWCVFIINRELPTIIVSTGFLAVPVLSLIISACFMHEPITLTTIAAMTLILSGLFLVVT